MGSPSECRDETHPAETHCPSRGPDNPGRRAGPTGRKRGQPCARAAGLASFCEGDAPGQGLLPSKHRARSRPAAAARLPPPPWPAGRCPSAPFLSKSHIRVSGNTPGGPSQRRLCPRTRAGRGSRAFPLAGGRGLLGKPSAAGRGAPGSDSFTPPGHPTRGEWFSN